MKRNCIDVVVRNNLYLVDLQKMTRKMSSLQLGIEFTYQLLVKRQKHNIVFIVKNVDSQLKDNIEEEELFVY